MTASSMKRSQARTSTTICKNISTCKATTLTNTTRRMMKQYNLAVLVMVGMILPYRSTVNGFGVTRPNHHNHVYERGCGFVGKTTSTAWGNLPPSRRSHSSSSSSSNSNTQLNMVFDFFKKRSQEGIEQLGNIRDAAARGELGKGLSDAAAYSKATNEAFAIGLAKSRNRFLQNLESLFTGVSPEELLEELEDILLQADLGTTTTEDIIQEVESLRDDSTKFLSKNDLMSILRGKLIEVLETSAVEGNSEIRFSQDESIPTILFIMGANGMGKTTTIGKLANRLRVEGNQTVLMAACDTFRAGAVEQLEMWATRSESDIVVPDEKTKTPAAVLYKALDQALTGTASNGKKYDTLLVDTSGRLSNNDALTQELAKMKRVIQKRLSKGDDEEGKPIFNTDVPHETLLVLDAAQGRMALDSAKTWNTEIGLTGLILTKLDGSARGGSVVSISRDLQLPVKLIGVGECIDDLRDFERGPFVDGLLGIDSDGGKGGSKRSEGEMLAGRLEELRKQRDQRASAMTEKEKERMMAGVGASNANTNAPPPAARPNVPDSVLTANALPRSARPKSSKKKRKGKK